MVTEIKRIEKEIEISAYIAKLKHALKNGAKISFQEDRKVDEERNIKNTNKYTVASLFPNENPVDALRRELQTLTVSNYICSVSDTRFPKRSEMRVFGKKYNVNEDVYIKIRVELFDPSGAGNHTTFVMSFHFAEKAFTSGDFPYGNKNYI